MRRILFWVHLALGVTVGLVIGVMATTGVLLGFQRQITEWIDGTPRVTAAASAARLPLDDLLSRASIPAADVDSLVLRADRRQAVAVTLHNRARPAVALDPFTGAAVTVPTSHAAQDFFSGVRRWHRYLGTNTGPWRASAVAVTGAADIALGGLVMLGLCLWWPPAWTPAVWRARAVLRPRLRGRARDFNWHHAVGIWAAVPLLVIAASGVFMAYKWPALWLDRALGTPAEHAAAIAALNAPASSTSAPKEESGTAPSLVKPGDASPGALFAAVEQMHPRWQTVTLVLPTLKEPHAQATVAEGNTFRPDLRWTILLDPVSAAPVTVASYQTMSLSRQIRSWYRYTHTGEVFGVAGQIVATLAAAGAVLLVWTGLALARRRFRRAARSRSVGVERIEASAA